jgi:hypothetical protein
MSTCKFVTPATPSKQEPVAPQALQWSCGIDRERVESARQSPHAQVAAYGVEGCRNADLVSGAARPSGGIGCRGCRSPPWCPFVCVCDGRKSSTKPPYPPHHPAPPPNTHPISPPLTPPIRRSMVKSATSPIRRLNKQDKRVRRPGRGNNLSPTCRCYTLIADNRWLSIRAPATGRRALAC